MNYITGAGSSEGLGLEDVSYGLQEGSRMVRFTGMRMVEQPSFEDKALIVKRIELDVLDIDSGDTCKCWCSPERTPKAKITKIMTALNGGKVPDVEVLKQGKLSEAFLSKNISNKTVVLASVIKKDDGIGTKIDSWSPLPAGMVAAVAAKVGGGAAPGAKKPADDDNINF
jgi:hypothetical protein